MIRICCDCRKKLNEKGETVGQPIPRGEVEKLAETELITHGYCRPCFEVSFGKVDASDVKSSAGPLEQNPSYRSAMIDAGRGRLLG